jgi:pimeloyl-ACP methyl ester carboxylesterase
VKQAIIDGVTLEYEVVGAGEPVVFIHGAFIADTFRLMLAEPSLARYQLIHYHRRGYAGSRPATDSISIKQHADDCRSLLLHLGITRGHVVGHSLGGCIALQLALDIPAMVHTLALLEPALAVGASAQVYRESLARGRHRYRDVGATVALDEALEARWPRYREALERAIPGAFSQALADAATSFELDLPGLLDWQFGESEARRMVQPTLTALGGDSDVLWARFGETHRLLLAWLPQGEGVVIPGVTHFMQVQEPSQMAEALAAYWARHPLPS